MSQNHVDYVESSLSGEEKFEILDESQRNTDLVVIFIVAAGYDHNRGANYGDGQSNIPQTAVAAGGIHAAWAQFEVGDTIVTRCGTANHQLDIFQAAIVVGDNVFIQLTTGLGGDVDDCRPIRVLK